MFDRLKKAFAREPAGAPAAPDAGAFTAVQQWAASQQIRFSTHGPGCELQGQVAGKPWRMEIGRPSRKYVTGAELRAKAELAPGGDVLVVVLNRPLRDLLEKQAYAVYTDSLQTSVNASLPEEMRLLAMYKEARWDELPRPFWARYAVVADERGHAQAWLDPVLAKLMLEWPVPAPSDDVPFMLMLMRGKVYLRMQHEPLHMPTLQHATQIFTSAAENAAGAFPA